MIIKTSEVTITCTVCTAVCNIFALYLLYRSLHTQYSLIIAVFLFSKTLPWRWQPEWPKHVVATIQQTTSLTFKCSCRSAVPCVAPDMISAVQTNMNPRIISPNEAQQLWYHHQPITATQINTKYNMTKLGELKVVPHNTAVQTNRSIPPYNLPWRHMWGAELYLFNLGNNGVNHWRPRPGRFTPRNDPIPTVREARSISTGK
jgi:hypothetical protein